MVQWFHRVPIQADGNNLTVHSIDPVQVPPKPVHSNRIGSNTCGSRNTTGNTNANITPHLCSTNLWSEFLWSCGLARTTWCCQCLPWPKTPSAPSSHSPQTVLPSWQRMTKHQGCRCAGPTKTSWPGSTSTTRVRLMDDKVTIYFRATIRNLDSFPCLSTPLWLPWMRASLHACGLENFTSDLAVVSICLHYVAWVTFAVVWSWAVVTQLTAWTRAFTLISIWTCRAVFHQPVTSCTATTLHNNHLSGTVADRTLDRLLSGCRDICMM